VNKGNDATRRDVVRAAQAAFPGKTLVISTNLPYPLSTAKELGEVWVVDARTDRVLYSTPRANHKAVEELTKLASGTRIGLGVRQTLKPSPLPPQFKERMAEEIRERFIEQAVVSASESDSTDRCIEWFGAWTKAL
jgi:hypothetical protein